MRMSVFRLFAGLLGVGFLWVIFFVGLQGNFLEAVMCGLVAVAFLIYAIWGEHPLVYCLLGVPVNEIRTTAIVPQPEDFDSNVTNDDVDSQSSRRVAQMPASCTPVLLDFQKSRIESQVSSKSVKVGIDAGN